MVGDRLLAVQIEALFLSPFPRPLRFHCHFGYFQQSRDLFTALKQTAQIIEAGFRRIVLDTKRKSDENSISDQSTSADLVRFGKEKWTMTVYDGVMALVVFFTTLHGFWKGATWQIAPIMSLVLGYMVAMPMSVTTAHWFGDPPQNRLFALVTIYIGVSLVVYLLVRSFRDGIEKAKLTEFDRHLGALLGALKGILLTLSTTVILLIYSATAREIILKSESRTIAAKIINAVYPILPQAMHKLLSPYLHQLDGELPLDLHETDPEGFLNSTTLPSRGSPLTPTSNARRAPFEVQDYSHEPPRRSRPLVDEDGYGPPTQPARRPAPRSDNRGYQDDSGYDSVNRNTRRIQTDHPSVPNPPARRRVIVPTPTAQDDDPFHTGNPDRYESTRR